MRHTVFWFVVTDLLGGNCTMKKNTATVVVASTEAEKQVIVNNEKLRT